MQPWILRSAPSFKQQFDVPNARAQTKVRSVIHVYSDGSTFSGGFGEQGVLEQGQGIVNLLHAEWHLFLFKKINQPAAVIVFEHAAVPAHLLSSDCVEMQVIRTSSFGMPYMPAKS